MLRVTMHKAKSDLSRLVARARAGEEVVLMRGDVPMVRLVSVDAKAVGRQPGTLRGVISLDEAFFEPLPADELARWGG